MTVSTWTATSARSWRYPSSGGGSGGWRSENNAYQGQYSSFGLHKGLWFFNDASIRSTLSGRTITNVRLRLTREDGGGVTAAQTPTIRRHNYSSQPSGEPSYTSGTVTSQSWAWGNTKYVSLSNTWGNSFRDGNARGVGVYTTSNSPYMIFSANAILEITHEASVTAPATPNTPTIASLSSTQFTLSTNTPAGTETWEWNPQDAGSAVAVRTVPSYTRSGSPGNTYKVRVRACNSAGCSSYSAYRTILMHPATPTGVQVSTAHDEATVTWNSQTLGTGGEYEVRRNGVTVHTTSSTSWTDEDRSPSTRYSYSIRATNNSGSSSWTSVVYGVTKAEPTTLSALRDVSQAATQLQDGTTVYAVVDGDGDYEVRRALLDGNSVALGTIPTDPNTVQALKRSGVPQSIAMASDRDGNVFVVGQRGSASLRVGFFTFVRTGPDSWTRVGVRSLGTATTLPQNFALVWVDEGGGNDGAGRLLAAYSSGENGITGYLHVDAAEAIADAVLVSRGTSTSPSWLAVNSSYGTMEGSGIALATDSLGSTRVGAFAAITNRVTGGSTDVVRLSRLTVTSVIGSVSSEAASPAWVRPSAQVVGYGSDNFAAVWGVATDQQAVKRIGSGTTKTMNSDSAPASALAAADYSSDDEAVFVYFFHPVDGLARRPWFTETGAEGTREVVDATIPAAPRDLRVPPVVDGRYIEAQYATGDATFTRVQTSHNQPPDAPDLDPITAFDAADAKAITWTFQDPNPTDTQGAYELAVENVDSGASVIATGKVTSSTESYTITAATLTNGVSYRVRVRTWDAQDEEGPWSPWVFFSPTAAATVAITAPAPAAFLIDSSVSVTWTYTHPSDDAQTEYRVRLLLTGTATVAKTSGWVASAATTYELTGMETGDYDLEVQARTSGVPSNVDAQGLEVDVTTPDEPLIVVDVKEGYVRVSTENPAPTGDRPSVEENWVYRRPEGVTSWTRIAVVGNSEAYEDYSAASGVLYDYKVRAVGVGGGTLDSVTAQATLHLEGIWLHDPEDPAGTLTNFRYKAGGRKEDFSVETELLHFAGRDFPVADYGEQSEQSLETDLFLPYEDGFSGTAYLRERVAARKTLAYRDNRGRVLFAALHGLTVEDVAAGTVVALSVSRVFYDEEV